MSNHTNNRWLTIVTLLLLTANIVTLALLWTNKKPEREHFTPPPQPQPGGEVFEFITRELNLDSTQQETYRKLRDEHRLQVRPLQDSIGMAKDRFFGLLKQENVADSIVENFNKKTAALEQQRDLVTFRHFQKVRAICTKEQKIKFDSIIQQAMHQMARPRPPRHEIGKDERPLPRPGMKPDGKRPPPPPVGEMRPAGGPPPGRMRPPPRDMKPPPVKDSF
ncbi:MAG: periplasmic heavy metal sensor [Ferruginibacter sp.]|nr:periplasmic heavy metal sensor [Ferruginibacter sp.]